MGLTKQYLRFVPGPIFGVISSATAKVLFLNSEDKKQQLLAVPSCENVVIWNYRTGEKEMTFNGDKHAVTCLTGDPARKHVAVGYADGTVRVFDVSTGSCTVSFCGHKSAVTCLEYDAQSLRLASGSKDKEVVLWDIVGESGLFRLKGHKAPITKCTFMKQRNILISSSEDTLLKFWSLDSKHCFKTMVVNNEVLDFVLIGDRRLIAGVDDSNLRVWDLQFKDSEAKFNMSVEFVTEQDLDIISIVKTGSVFTQGDKRIVGIGVDESERLLGCHSYSKCLQLFKILTPEEASKKLRKQKKKEQKRLKDEVNGNTEVTLSVSDEIEKMKPIQTDAKIVTFVSKMEKIDIAKIAVLLNNNSFCIYSLDVNVRDVEPSLLHIVTSGGHRSPANTVSFNSDGLMVLSASSESVKVWNTETQRCTHTFSCEVALCSAFVTGNSYCIIGTKCGKLQIFDLSTHQLIENVDAHDGPVNSLCPVPDQRGITSGSSDKDVKFWEYELVKDESYSEVKKRLTLIHTRTLKTMEEILCLKYSPNQKFLAASLLDCTVKVFFSDTLKFAFSLYGHKLPICCLDISYDSTLLVTGSKDKNIKIWSLEFGNCIKSVFAHDESVTCLQFLPKTHMFFTGSKDKKIKQWDGDNFQKIVTLEGHLSKVNALAISPDGTAVFSSSHDKSLRLWEKTNEPLVLEEELEIEREKETDKQLTNVDPVIVGETNKDIGLATKTTVKTLKTVEQLIEAIDIHKAEVEKLEEHSANCKLVGKDLPLPTLDPMLTAYSVTCPYQFMLKIFQKSRSSHLEESLLHLPFNYVIELLKILMEFSSRKWEVELTTRCILFLVRLHLCQLSVCQEVFPLVDSLKDVILEELAELKDTVGFNIAGLKFLQKQIGGCEELSLVDDAMLKFQRKSRKRRLVTFL